MKNISFAITFCFLVVFASAQTQTPLNTGDASTTVNVPALDKSPLDVSYFPVDYPISKTQNKAATSPLIRVIYSRPQKDNRNIFGELIEYNKVWRLGANEATEIEFFKDATVAERRLQKDDTPYMLFHQKQNGQLFLTRTQIHGVLLHTIKRKMF